VLQKGRQRHFEWFGEDADGSRPASQSFEYGSPRGIGERLKDAIKLRHLVSHVPNYA